jgi:putative nucleotidyltransferase with HDIG domain
VKLAGLNISANLFTTVTLSILLLAVFYFGFDSRGAISDRNLVIGSPVPEGIIAVHDFVVPYSESELEEMGREGEASIPIFLTRDTEAELSSAEQIREIVYSASSDEALALYVKQRISSLYSPGIVDLQALRMISQGSSAVVDNGSMENISELFTLTEARDGIRLDLERRGFPDQNITQVLNLIVANLTVDSAARNNAVTELIAELPSIKQEFHTGEEILPKGGLFTEEISRNWDAMVVSPAGNQGIIEHNMAKTGLAAVLLLLGILYVSREQTSAAFTASDVFLLFASWGLTLLFTALLWSSGVPGLSVFSFTMLGAGLTAVFFDSRARKRTRHFSWFLSAVFAAMFALASPHPMTAFFMGFIPACLVAAAIKNLSDSGISMALLLGTASSVMVYWLLSAAGSSGSMDLSVILWLFLIFLPLVITGTIRVMIHPFEMLFGAATDLTYSRLDNNSHPLREELRREARGTYIHSVIVADLAFAAARVLGVDERLARLGGMYHDIGKLANPGMFIENVANPAENSPHLAMPPADSVREIIGHVKRGVELARKHKLPADLRNIIQQHHGDGSAKYFLEKARRELPPGTELDETVFHYNCPRPQSIEAALVMLADSVSSGVTGLGKDATAGQKEAMIARITQEKADEGQFDDCNFTGSMRARVAFVFMDVLNRNDGERVPGYPHGK